MRLEFAGCSEIGMVRRENEDTYLMRACHGAGLFLVADGVGSREYGNAASEMLRDEYARWWDLWFLTIGKDTNFYTAVEEIRKVLLKLNRTITQKFGVKSSGSTLVLLFLFRGQCLYLSSGDSRIYRARGWFSFRQITVDDVYENYRSQAETLEKKSVGKLVGAVGISRELIYSMRTDKVRRGDVFFLCSDGVHRYVPIPSLYTKILIKSWNPDRTVAELSDIVEQNGAKDNYTMICVCVRRM